MSKRLVYKYLVCEFDHWDVCLKGLIKKDGQYYFCNLIGSNTKPKYRVYKIIWTKDCENYLRDYKKAYLHWFHPRTLYNGRTIEWFKNKWKGKNPIYEQSKHSSTRVGRRQPTS